MKRIAVTGPRDFGKWSVIKAELFREFEFLDLAQVLVIHGNCPQWKGKNGVDVLTEDVCRTYGIHTAKVDARWEVYKRPAGPVRNGIMLRLQPEKLLAFWPSKSRGGTTDCMKQAEALGIEVRVIES